MKTGPDVTVLPRTSSGVQNIKTGPDALDIVKNGSRSATHENWTRLRRYRRKRLNERKTVKRDPTHLAPPKKISGAQDMKTEPDALDTAQNGFVSAKHEN
jgi:hypothetical protein